MSKRLHAPRAQETSHWPPLHPAGLPASQLSPVVRSGTQSGGQALNRKTEAQMASWFGHNFSDIRVHTDRRAEQSARALGADAYTVGGDIVFGAGQYRPGSSDTERLLAHELTHAVQQSQWGPGDPSRASRRGDASEREADAAASQMTAGRGVRVQAAPGAAVAREEASGGSGWKAWDDNPLWNFVTHDSLSGGVGITQEHLNNLHKGEAGAAIAKENAMQDEFRLKDYGDRHGWSPNESGSAEEIAGQKNLWRAGADLEEDAHLGTAMQVEKTVENTASRFSGPLSVARNVARFLGPLGMYSDGTGMVKDWKEGNYADATAEGLGFASSTIATTEAAGAGLSWAGATGLGGALGSVAEFLNPAGALAGSAAGGYGLGKLALGGANSHAKNNNLFGKGEDGESRNSTEAAADAGVRVRDAVSDFDIGGYQLPGQKYLGDFAGGVTSVVGSWGTAGYSGLHALGGGIKDDAGWLWDHTFGTPPPSDKELAASQKQAQAVMDQDMDARMNADEESRLYNSSTSVAHEEMPPLPPKEERRH